MHAQDLRVVLVGVTPDLCQQRAVGHEAAAVLDQHSQQLELSRGHVHRVPVERHGVRRQVDLERTFLQDRLTRRTVDTPQGCTEARDQLAGPKGLVT